MKGKRCREGVRFSCLAGFCQRSSTASVNSKERGVVFGEEVQVYIAREAKDSMGRSDFDVGPGANGCGAVALEGNSSEKT